MNKSTLLPYYLNTSMHTFNIVGDLRVTVSIKENPFRLPLDTLFSMAARINKKRAFLFVSKVLGKHLPVNPHVSLLSGATLALLLYRELSHETIENQQVNELLTQTIHGLTQTADAKNVYEQVINSRLKLPAPVEFIGFAETATALGHSMYNVFDGGCSYIHTTREFIPAMTSIINFDEEHSHAVSHRCYAINSSIIAGKETIVLVDDEITTGNTALNFIKDIHSKFPRNNYIVASLLDWRTPEDEMRYARLEQQLGISIKSLSLMKGIIEVVGSPILSVFDHEAASNQHAEKTQTIESIYLNDLFQLVNHESQSSTGSINTSPYLAGTGRFGINANDNMKLNSSVAAAACELALFRVGRNTLCLGTGEFMYLPMRIAAEMGEGVSYHSTTRSPVHAVQADEYAIKQSYSFASPDDSAVTNYIYNIFPGEYDDLFLFYERDIPRDNVELMLEEFRTMGFKKINVVVCGPKIY
jgi:hypothetical protein